MSFSFSVEEGAFVDAEAGAFYELRKLDLYEVSVVPIGMNQATEIVSVKALKEEEQAHQQTSRPEQPVEEETSEASKGARRETAARRLRALEL